MTEPAVTFISGAIFGMFLMGCIAIGIREHQARVACESRICAAGEPMLIEGLRCVCAIDAASKEH